MFTSSLPNRWSRGLTGVLLALAVACAGGLAWESWRSARSAQRTADAVLHDYAAFAAWQFTRVAQARLDATAAGVLDRVRHDLDGRHGAPVRPGIAMDDCGCAGGPDIVSSFEMRGDAAPRVVGAPLSASATAAIREAIEPASVGAGRRVVVLTGSDTSDPGVAIMQVSDARGRRVIGGIIAQAVVGRLLAEAFARSELLPQALIGQASSPEVFALAVLRADGVPLFSSGALGGQTARADWGRLTVDASIDPAFASQLVIGGLPADRWPVAAGLLGVSALLVVLAVAHMRREVRQARRQSAFVSGVSHELRTPLAQIRLYGETLMLGRVRSDLEARRAAEIIVQEARRLGTLVDTVLLFSRIQHGRFTIEREATDVRALIKEVADGFRPFAAARGCAIRCEVRGDDREVRIDPNATRQILLNLLDNAVKYGPAGQTVSVVADLSADAVRLAVADEGPGVPSDQRRHVWEPFWRAPGLSQGGSGLGLAIVETIARRHGGRAWLDTAASRGARFEVLLAA